MKKKLKKINKGAIIIITVILWFMLFPFIFLYDRLFGKWKK